MSLAPAENQHIQSETGTSRRQDVTGWASKGVQLQSMEDAWRFATAVARSRFAPKGMETPEAILVAIQAGAELGLGPFQSIQSIAVINGRPGVYGDAALGVVQASPCFDHDAFEETIEDSKAGIKATCTVRRLPNGKPVTRSFTLEDAKRAGLLGKSGPWSQYPARMCQWRARHWALRDAFSDVLKGMVVDEDPAPAATVEQVSGLDDLTAKLEGE